MEYGGDATNPYPTHCHPCTPRTSLQLADLIKIHAESANSYLQYANWSPIPMFVPIIITRLFVTCYTCVRIRNCWKLK